MINTHQFSNYDDIIELLHNDFHFHFHPNNFLINKMIIVLFIFFIHYNQDKFFRLKKCFCMLLLTKLVGVKIEGIK